MLASPERRKIAPTDPGAREPPPWRAVAAGPVVAIVTVVAALVATRDAGVPLRDPNQAAASRFVVAACVVVVLIALDILIRAGRRPSLAALRRVRRERWTWGRCAVVGSAVVSFFVTYMAYRNVKSVVPLVRPGELFDGRLADLDRSLFAGQDPAALLHTLLGAGVAAHTLSFVYELFFVFVPLSLAIALVLSADLRAGLFYATALSFNWVLAALSYLLLPSLGPIYAEPASFAQLPATGVSHLQETLLTQRLEFLGDPSAAGAAQSIGAFASLHVSIFFTAAMATNILVHRRYVKVVVWALFALTVVATVYFGWHYVLDDLGGLVIGVVALAAASVLTGFDLRTARRLPAPNPALA